jgi:hypothetical protein
VVEVEEAPRSLVSDLYGSNAAAVEVTMAARVVASVAVTVVT